MILRCFIVANQGRYFIEIEHLKKKDISSDNREITAELFAKPSNCRGFYGHTSERLEFVEEFLPI